MSGRTLPPIEWAHSTGNLAHALGIEPGNDWIGPIVEKLIDQGAGIRTILDTVQRDVPDCTFGEWTAMCFALGYYNGVTER